MIAWQSPLLLLDPERAHGIALAALRGWTAMGAPGRIAPDACPRLATGVAGLSFPNPIGLAAGLDKDGEAAAGLFALGFGMVEVGTLTPLPQPGNPRPRLFRLAAERGVVNRMGFNNSGLEAALARLAGLKRAARLGINVGANKEAVDRLSDYAGGIAAAAPFADYLTINISSPNTPGLRDLQEQPALGELLARCDAARRLADGRRVPLFLKVAPDLDRSGIDTAVRAAIDAGIDALIVGNTTVSRPGTSGRLDQAGGLSGAPLAPLARQKLAEARRASGGALPLIAAGGIGSGAEAYARIRAGASLVQLYSALVYGGPGLPARMLRDLGALLARDGFASVAEAVGVDALA